MSPFAVPIVLLLILANALYVAAEFASVGVRRGQLHEAAKTSRTARRMLLILEDPVRLDRYIATCQIGITLTSLVLGAYGQIAFTPSLATALSALLGWGYAVSLAASAALVLVVLTVLQVVIGELVPKSLALQFPLRTALLTNLPTMWSMTLFRPFSALLNGSALGILRMLRLPAGSHHHVHSPEELELLVAESRDGGLLEDEEHRMLAGALRLRQRPAHQLMVPRPQVLALSVDTPVEAALAKVMEAPYTRIPVYADDPANIIGILHTKDLTQRAFTGPRAQHTRELVRPVVVVPDSLPGDQVLVRLREARSQMAVVVDEHGTAVGILTFDDVLAEMLGSTTLRAPRAYLTPERLPDGRVRLPGLLPITRAPAWLSAPAESEAHTVAGLVLEGLGRIPDPGDALGVGGVRLVVERMTGRRIDTVLVEGAPPEAPESQESEGA